MKKETKIKIIILSTLLIIIAIAFFSLVTFNLMDLNVKTLIASILFAFLWDLIKDVYKMIKEAIKEAKKQ